MSNYTQVTAFTPKDSLVSGNPAKIIKGSEFDSEFSAIAAAVNSKTDISTTTAELALKVTGPATTTDNAIARYDGTTGKLIQSSSATLDDSGNASFSGRVSGNTVSASAGMYGVANGFYQGYGLYNDAGNWKNTESGSGGWLWRKDDNTFSLLQGSTTGTAGTVVVPATRMGFDASGNATFSGNVTVGANLNMLLGNVDFGNNRFNVWRNTAGSASSGTAGAFFGKADDNNVYLQNFEGDTVFQRASYAATLTLSAAGNATFGGNVTVGGGTLGYGASSGGTVTQATSKSTAVTLNKPSGQITMHNDALAAGATVGFQFDNTNIAAVDTCDLCISTSTPNFNQYRLFWYVGPGNAVVYLTNTSGSSYSDAVVINFKVIKGSTT